MELMFYNCKNFNQDISSWNVSKVEKMRYMFKGCENFCQDLYKWNTNNYIDYSGCFENCPKMMKQGKYWPHKFNWM